jgi:hypothetical protein
MAVAAAAAAAEWLQQQHIIFELHHFFILVLPCSASSIKIPFLICRYPSEKMMKKW